MSSEARLCSSIGEDNIVTATFPQTNLNNNYYATGTSTSTTLVEQQQQALHNNSTTTPLADAYAARCRREDEERTARIRSRSREPVSSILHASSPETGRINNIIVDEPERNYKIVLSREEDSTKILKSEADGLEAIRATLRRNAELLGRRGSLDASGEKIVGEMNASGENLSGKKTFFPEENFLPGAASQLREECLEENFEGGLRNHPADVGGNTINCSENSSDASGEHRRSLMKDVVGEVMEMLEDNNNTTATVLSEATRRRKNVLVGGDDDDEDHGDIRRSSPEVPSHKSEFFKDKKKSQDSTLHYADVMISQTSPILEEPTCESGRIQESEERPALVPPVPLQDTSSFSAAKNLHPKEDLLDRASLLFPMIRRAHR